MKLYAKRQIGDEVYKVYAAPHELSGDGGQVLEGLFVPEKTTIIFNKENKEWIWTLIHEELHGVIKEYDFDQIIESQAEELLIERVLGHFKKFYVVYPKKSLLE